MNDQLKSYLPRNKPDLDVSAMHPDDRERLERVAASKIRKERVFPEYAVEHGPTAERSAKAQGNVVIGDDRQGTRIYHFLDTPLARFYKRLGVEDKSDSNTDQLRREFVALMKYRDHWYYAGMEAKSGSVDFDRVQTSMSGLEGSERRVHHTIVYRRAAKMLGMWSAHVVEHIACLDRSISQCSAYGIGVSPYIFRKMLRDAANKLAESWKV